MINWDFVNGVGDHIATLEKVNSAMNDEITRLRAEVARLTQERDTIIERCAEVCFDAECPDVSIGYDFERAVESCAAAIRAMKG